jgi:hypothetical protein
MCMSRYTFGLLLFLVAACNSPASESEKKVPDLSAGSATLEISGDENQPVRTVRQYLRWCATHQNTLPNDFILNGDGQDTTKFYAVNFSGTESWLMAVQNSGLVSEMYLNGWRAHFRQYADSLRLHPQNDGPPAGFEFDFLTLSQEPDEQVAELLSGTATVTEASAMQAVVQTRGPRHEGWQAGLDFELNKDANGRWLIDKISPAESGF